MSGPTVGALGRCAATVVPHGYRRRGAVQCVRTAVMVVRGLPLCWMHRDRGAGDVTEVAVGAEHRRRLA